MDYITAEMQAAADSAFWLGDVQTYLDLTRIIGEIKSPAEARG